MKNKTQKPIGKAVPVIENGKLKLNFKLNKKGTKFVKRFGLHPKINYKVIGTGTTPRRKGYKDEIWEIDNTTSHIAPIVRVTYKNKMTREQRMKISRALTGNTNGRGNKGKKPKKCVPLKVMRKCQWLDADGKQCSCLATGKRDVHLDHEVYGSSWVRVLLCPKHQSNDGLKCL